jgi:hypothetical protein
MSVFRKDYRYTPDATAIEGEICVALGTIFDKYVGEGKSPREVSHLVMLMAMELEMEAVFDHVEKEDK